MPNDYAFECKHCGKTIYTSISPFIRIKTIECESCGKSNLLDTFYHKVLE